MKLWSLQAVRFFAALAVVHFHAANVASITTGSHGLLGPRMAEFGRAGVDVFFVLSGVVIALAARKATAGEFAFNRVRRIFPIYLVAMVPFALIAAGQGAFDWRAALSSFFLWPLTDSITPPLLPVGWTLCFEVLFYAAVTLVVWRRVLLWPLLAAFAVALAFRVGFLGNPMILEFLAGVALTYAPRWRPAVWALPLGVGLLLVTALGGLLPATSEAGLLAGDIGWTRVATMGIPAALIIWGALQIEIKPGVLTYLGDASYALYLIHPLVSLLMVAVLTSVPAALPADVWIVLGIALSLLAGWQFHERVEKPILAFLGRRPAPVTA